MVIMKMLELPLSNQMEPSKMKADGRIHSVAPMYYCEKLVVINKQISSFWTAEIAETISKMLLVFRWEQLNKQ